MNTSAAAIKFGKFEGTLEDTSCPLGDSRKPKLIFMSKEGIGYFKCDVCNIMYASPRFTEASMMKIYETEAFADFSDFEDWSYEKWLSGGDRTYITQRQKVMLVKRFLSDGSRLLDVGCGLGWFVLEAGKSGYSCEGVEPSEMLSRVASDNLGVKVSTVEIDDFSPDHKFDGILIWDVLEHLYDPVGVLKRCVELLEPGGYLFAQVPNHKGISNTYKTVLSRLGLRKHFKHFGFPWHVYSFDKVSLSAMMRAVGLEPVFFESWANLLKAGRRDIISKLIIEMYKKLCISDYIVCVARKA